MDNKITIGARGSKLSLAYANKVKSNILSQVQGIDKEIIIKSSDDIDTKQLNISFSKNKVLFFDKNKKRIR